MHSLILALTLTMAQHSPLSAPPGYEHAVHALPAEHWALVQSAVVNPTAGNSSSSRANITLVTYRGDRTLWHEVGHVFMRTHPDIDQAWRMQFWPNGTQIGHPVTGYARTNPAEDEAESYEWYMQDGTLSDPDRAAFLRDYVFGHQSVQPPTVVAVPPPVHQSLAMRGPCDQAGIPSGSIVAGCSSVPSGSVIP